MDIPWILVSIAVIVVILAIISVLMLKRKGWKRKVDYRSYFNTGIVWFVVCIIFYLVLDSVIGIFFFIMGLVYLSVGLKNKDKWGKPQKVSPKYQKIMLGAVAVVVIALALGIIVFEMFYSGVSKIEKACTDSGGTVKTSLCCKSVSDFPNNCLIGACGCSPENSHDVKVCECPEDKCFDGNACVSI
jgi:formate hydrogenlyase subunit 3/multisubunit Na+/H+ antiporter MnhD subunit